VARTLVGYMGGSLPNPTYGNYSLHGYSETLWVEFNPKNVTYDELLTIFWASHDPTFEVSTGYRSLLWPQNAEQLRMASRSLAYMQSITKPPLKIWTRIHENATDYAFWPAEAYHQHYEAKMGERCPPDQHTPAPEACPDTVAPAVTRVSFSAIELIARRGTLRSRVCASSRGHAYRP